MYISFNRRWKSEYQSTYKPFWRFDYKDGKWYKDPAVVTDLYFFFNLKLCLYRMKEVLIQIYFGIKN